MKLSEMTITELFKLVINQEKLAPGGHGAIVFRRCLDRREARELLAEGAYQRGEDRRRTRARKKRAAK